VDHAAILNGSVAAPLRERARRYLGTSIPRERRNGSEVADEYK